MSPTLDIADARIAVVDPDTAPVILQDIAAHHPSLWALVASHPNTNPEVLAWLQRVGDESVLNALAAREMAMPFDDYITVEDQIVEDEPLQPEPAPPPVEEPAYGPAPGFMTPPGYRPPPASYGPAFGAPHIDLGTPPGDFRASPGDFRTPPSAYSATTSEYGSSPDYDVPFGDAHPRPNEYGPPHSFGPPPNFGATTGFTPPYQPGQGVPHQEPAPPPGFTGATGFMPPYEPDQGVAYQEPGPPPGFAAPPYGAAQGPASRKPPPEPDVPPQPVTDKSFEAEFLAPWITEVSAALDAKAETPPPSNLPVNTPPAAPKPRRGSLPAGKSSSTWYTTTESQKRQSGRRSRVIILIAVLILAILGGSGALLLSNLDILHRPAATTPPATSADPPVTAPPTTLNPVTKPPTVGLPWISDQGGTSFDINFTVTNPTGMVYTVCLYNMGVQLACWNDQRALTRTFTTTVDGDYSSYALNPTVMLSY